MLVWLGVLGIGLSLGLLGGGGSILAVPLLVYGFGIETNAAMATSLLVVGITSIITMIPYALRGQVCRRVGLVFGLAAMIGPILGVGEPASSRLRSSPRSCSPRPWRCCVAAPKRKAWHLPTCRLVRMPAPFRQGGSYSQDFWWVARPGSSVRVAASWWCRRCTSWGRLPMHAAIGTSVLVIAMTSFAGFAAYVQHVDVNYPLAGLLILVASIGTLLGSVVANRVQNARLKQGFGIFILSIAAYSLYREFSSAWLMESVHGHPVFWLIGLALGAIALIIGRVLKVASRRGVQEAALRQDA